jgi:eukaryotic-like serine/threonine-protein kinase
MTLDASTHFGKYIVLQRIGVGGMAEIFKCRLPGLGGFDKLVVVKRILPDQAQDPVFVNMFMDEARVAANLSHPNIAQTYEIGETEGVPYIAMEYVHGPTLAQLFKAERKAGRRDLGVVAKILAGVCAGLHSAHNALDGKGNPLNIIHRDVTPHNILVSLDGIPKLVDFGVAKARGNLAVTQADGLKGKLWYMAPEQFHGPAAMLDQRVDVFGVGVCLYQAATGRVPYHGLTEVELLGAASSGRFPRPSEVDPTVPPEIERIILWAMAPKKEDRCPDCETLEDSLERLAASEVYASGTRRVGEYVRELFPDIESNPNVGLGTGSVTPSRSSRPQTRSTASRRSQATGSRSRSHTRRRPPWWQTPARIGFAMLGLALVGNGTIVLVRALLSRQEPPTAVALGPQPLRAAEEGTKPTPERVKPPANEPSEPIAMVDEATDEEEDEDRRQRNTPRTPPRSNNNARRSTAPSKPAPNKKEKEREAEGRLTVVTDPPALVYLNEEPIGRSPIKNLPVKAGVHQLTTELNGYVAQERTVKVAAAREVIASLRLSRDTHVDLAPPVSGGAPPMSRAEEAASAKDDLPPPEPERRESAAPVTPPPAPPPPTSPMTASLDNQSSASGGSQSSVPELGCPEGAKVLGAAPPRGTLAWCELPSGIKHGRILRWHANGKKAEEGEYRQGKKHGRWIEYYENGGERDRTEWRKGVKSW